LDFDVVYTPYIAGSLVWAKVPGYPWYIPYSLVIVHDEPITLRLEKIFFLSSRWPGMVEDDPDYNCCYETDESNVNPVCMGQLNPGAYPTIQCVGVRKRGHLYFSVS
jgi:hypothetical protein